jgi:hypothetical protein
VKPNRSSNGAEQVNSVRGINSKHAPYIILLFINFVSYFGFYTGKDTPPWDFWGWSLADAHTWLLNGSFFRPIEYIPHLFGGYPAYLSIQNGSWFLPSIFIRVLTGNFGAHEAAVVQGLMVLFGSIGAYLLAKHFVKTETVRVMVGIAFTFTPGIIGNASHTDIIRGWAFFPWLILTFFVKFQERPALISVFTIIWFQFFITGYPGVMISSFYIFALWSLFFMCYQKSNKHIIQYIFLIPLIGLLLSLIKWLPYLFTLDDKPSPGNILTVSWRTLVTLTFPFSDNVFPNDVAMRTIFVSPLLLLACFVWRRWEKLDWLLLSTILVSLAFGVNFSLTNQWQNFLPLLDLSRFRMADFKLPFCMSILLLGARGLDYLILRKNNNNSRASLTTMITVATVLILLAKFSQISMASLIIGILFITISLLSLLTMILLPEEKKENRVNYPVKSLILNLSAFGLTIVGFMWAASAPTWSVNTNYQTNVIFGVPKSVFQNSDKIDLGSYFVEKTGPNFPTTLEELTATKWNVSNFNGTNSLGGYIDLAFQPRNEFMRSTISKVEYSRYYNSLKRPFSAWIVEKVDDYSQTYCDAQSPCQEISDVEIASPSRFKIELAQPSNGSLQINVIPYEGWTAQVCSEFECRTIEVPHSTLHGYLTVPIESTTKSVTFDFSTPYAKVSWGIFWFAFTLLLVISFFAFRKQKSQNEIRTTQELY